MANHKLSGPDGMRALVMAGGRGTRLKIDNEKPLIRVSGRPLIDHVLENLESADKITDITVVTSPNTPQTEKHVKDKGYAVIRTSGRGYVEDLQEVLETLEGHPAEPLFIMNADLPLVSGSTIDWIISEYTSSEEPAMCVAVPEELCRKHGIDANGWMDGLVPCGVNILMSRNIVQTEKILEASILELAVNVNTPRDLRILEEILGENDGRKEAD
ncbi:TIGR00454 family protein [Methanothermobacter wolfeii]|nr:TIGR00454 family protein [Methanothermobacter wolfeii]MDI6702123.1 TIGR00454 family protein [Methanothermobacter wolfeii]MDI6842416.1 TIGR00454 family protein [Methanothermobacter wolfeii]